jgi:hypothetical protein
MKPIFCVCLGDHPHFSADTELQLAEEGGNVNASLSGVTWKSLRELTLDSRAKPIAIHKRNRSKLLHNKGGRFILSRFYGV